MLGKQMDDPRLSANRALGDYEREEDLSRARRDFDSREELSESSASSHILGFGTSNWDEIMESVQEYAVQRLREEGQYSQLALDIIMDYFPKQDFHDRSGKQDYVTRNFQRCVKEIQPYTKKAFISVPQWVEAITLAGNDFGLSIPARIRMITRTGGIAQKLNETIRKRVVNLTRGSAMKEWIPQYDPARPSTDNVYWFSIWVDVVVKLITEFHTVQDAATIDGELAELLKEDRFKFTSTEDPVNEDFYKICLLYEELNVWLKQKSSDYANSPLMVFEILKKWVAEQGKETGAGTVMVNYIEKALAKLSTDPESVFPPFHKLSKTQLEDVKRRGRGEATQLTYSMVLRKLKMRATQKDLTFMFTTLAHATEMVARQNKAHEKKFVRKTNNVASTDCSTLTLNTSVPGGAGTTNVSSGGYAGQTRFPLCSDCNLFHSDDEGKCKFWDKKLKTFKVKAYLKHRSSRKVLDDGTSVVNPFWIHKLEKFCFPHIGITEEGKKKILKSLDEEAANWAPASENERKNYPAKHEKYVQLCKSEEARRHKAPAVGKVVNLAKEMIRPKESKPKKEKRKSKEESEDEDSIPSLNSDSSAGDDDSAGSN
jgi:hypothetical protein